MIRSVTWRSRCLLHCVDVLSDRAKQCSCLSPNESHSAKDTRHSRAKNSPVQQRALLVTAESYHTKSWAVSVLPKLSVNRNTYYTPFLTEAPQLSKKWWPHCSLWAVFCHRILCLLEDELTCRLKFFICVICKTFSWRREARACSFKRIKNVWLMLTLKSQA